MKSSYNGFKSQDVHFIDAAVLFGTGVAAGHLGLMRGLIKGVGKVADFCVGKEKAAQKAAERRRKQIEEAAKVINPKATVEELKTYVDSCLAEEARQAQKSATPEPTKEVSQATESEGTKKKRAANS